MNPVSYYDPSGYAAKCNKDRAHAGKSDGIEGVSKAELPSRNGALNQAKRDANILRSQKPDYIEKVKMTEAESRGAM